MSLMTKVLEGLVQTNLNKEQLRYIALHADTSPQEVEQILLYLNKEIRQNRHLFMHKRYIKRDGAQ